MSELRDFAMCAYAQNIMNDVLRKMNYDSNFIAIEGADGVGKSALLKRLKIDYFKNINFIRQPSNTLLGNAIRNVLQEGRKNKEIIRHMMLADLLDCEEKRVGVCISDRSILSYVVYQILICESRLGNYNDLKSARLPEKLILLECDMSDMKNRLKERKNSPSIYENQEILESVKRAYRIIQKYYEHLKLPICTINTSKYNEVETYKQASQFIAGLKFER